MSENCERSWWRLSPGAASTSERPCSEVWEGLLKSSYESSCMTRRISLKEITFVSFH